MPKFAQDILKDIEMDDEFREIVSKYSDKELTPMEMDLKVRMDRVMYILNRTLATIKVMVYLPTLLNNDAELLKKYLPPKDVYFILQLMNKYEGNFDVKDYEDKNYPDYAPMLDRIYMHRKPHKFTRFPSLEPVQYPHISQMINILFHNKCVRDLVRSSPDTPINPRLAHFMNAAEVMKKVVKDKIYETGEEEGLRHKELRMAYKHNILLADGIKELEQHLEKQRSELGEQLQNKVATFTMYNKKMEDIKEDFKQQLETKLTASEKEMMNLTVISEEKQAYLAEEARIVTKQYDFLIEDHISQEKQTRSKRFKTETQLQNWLIKYDQDIGERQAEFEAFKAKYDEEKDQMEDLEDLYEEQEDEYEFLMTEKAEEEERIYNEMAYHFLLSRSARTIQRAWKDYLQRKKSKKKGKKGKGKGGKKSGKAKKDMTEKDYFESAMARKLTVKTDRRTTRADDANALLEDTKFKTDVFEELQNPNAF